MAQNYVLMSFNESVIEDLSMFRHPGFTVLVFLPERMNEIPFRAVEQMQKFGPPSRFIYTVGNSIEETNLSMALMLGELSTQDPQGRFHVLTKDPDFDTVIDLLTVNAINAYRHVSLSDIFAIHLGNEVTETGKVEQIIRCLSAMDAKERPNTSPDLVKWVTNNHPKPFSRARSEAVVSRLEKERYIRISPRSQSVAYYLTEDQRRHVLKQRSWPIRKGLSNDAFVVDGAGPAMESIPTKARPGPCEPRSESLKR